MRQIRMTKRRRTDDWRLEPLPLDPRDPDIVRAKALARRARCGPGALNVPAAAAVTPAARYRTV